MQAITLLTEMRLKVFKAVKESAHTIGGLAAVYKHSDLVDELGAQVQNEINILGAQYASIGVDFDEFYDDLLEMLDRIGFNVFNDYIKDYIEEDGIVVFELECGLDKSPPYNMIGLSFQLMEGVK